MAYYKLNTDGTFQSANKQHEGFSHLSELTTKEDGSYYEFYNLDCTPDLVKIAEQEAIIQAQEAKQAKLEALANLTVTTTAGNVFDADDTARSDIMASLKSIDDTQTLLKSLTEADANAYISTNSLTVLLTIDGSFNITHTKWKLADNSTVAIHITELKEALALAIQAKGAIILGA